MNISGKVWIYEEYFVFFSQKKVGEIEFREGWVVHVETDNIIFSDVCINEASSMR